MARTRLKLKTNEKLDQFLILVVFKSLNRNSFQAHIKHSIKHLHANPKGYDSTQNTFLFVRAIFTRKNIDPKTMDGRWLHKL